MENRIAPATFVVTTFADELDGGTAGDPAGADHKISLREAISAANANMGPDTIVLKAGTYAIGLLGADDANASGDFDITESLVIKGAGKTTIIDGKGYDRVFDVFAAADGASFTFQNLTITHGLAKTVGGAIRTDAAHSVALSLTKVSVLNNQAVSKGGGLYVAMGDLSLTGSHVDFNSAGDRGGGIYVDTGMGKLAISASTLNHNSSGASGGGVSSFATGNFSLLKKSQMSFNSSAGNGGAAELSALNMTIDGSSFVQNFASSRGGAFDLTAGAAGQLTVTKSIFIQNVSESNGGAIDCGGTPASITDSTFTLNSSGGNGGALDGVSNILVVRSIFTGNFAQSFAGAINQTVSENIGIDGSTFRGNTATDGSGGAIKAIGGVSDLIALNDSVFDANRSEENGGALYAAGDEMMVTGCTFSGNFASLNGGAIDDPGRGIEIMKSSFLNNFAAKNGGGVAGEGALFLKVGGSTFTGNVAASGNGGAFSADGAPLVEVGGSLLRNNVAGAKGGGFTADGATLHLIGSTVSGNNAGTDGGGVYVYTSGAGTTVGSGGSFIGNATISGNVAQNAGGGLYVETDHGGDLTILHTTISFNHALVGAGILNTTTSMTGNGTTRVGNTIVAKNATGTSVTNGSDVFSNSTFGPAAFIDLGGNLIGIGDGSDGFTVSTLVGSSAASIDPKLGPLGLHGGITPTHLLLGGSPARDAALASIDTSFNITVDQRGKPRPHGKGPDIGAVEM